MYIQTVLGPVDPSEMGSTLTHEHIICDASLSRSSSKRVPKTEIMFLDDVDEMIEECKKFKIDGGGGIVEVTCYGWGRDPIALRKISEKSGIHIIATTGFYIEDFMPPLVATKTIDELASWIEREITIGCNARESNEITGIKAGIIKTSVSRPHFSHNELKGLHAVAKAQIKTGAPITSHNSGFIRFELEGGNIGKEMLDILEREGVDPEAVIVGHADENVDIRHLVSLVRRGAYVQFDTVGKSYLLDETRADLVLGLRERGYLKQVLLSHDQNRKPSLRKYGGPGYSDILNRFVPMLREKGMSIKDIDTVLVKNPARALRIRK